MTKTSAEEHKEQDWLGGPQSRRSWSWAGQNESSSALLEAVPTDTPQNATDGQVIPCFQQGLKRLVHMTVQTTQEHEVCSHPDTGLSTQSSNALSLNAETSPSQSYRTETQMSEWQHEALHWGHPAWSMAPQMLSRGRVRRSIWVQVGVAQKQTGKEDFGEEEEDITATTPFTKHHYGEVKP